MPGETGRVGQSRAIMVPQSSQECSSPSHGEDRRFKSGRDYVSSSRCSAGQGPPAFQAGQATGVRFPSRGRLRWTACGKLLSPGDPSRSGQGPRTVPRAWRGVPLQATYSPVAQSAERRPVKAMVLGSSPNRRAGISAGCGQAGSRRWSCSLVRPKAPARQAGDHGFKSR